MKTKKSSSTKKSSTHMFADFDRDQFKKDLHIKPTMEFNNVDETKVKTVVELLNFQKSAVKRVNASNAHKANAYLKEFSIKFKITYSPVYDWFYFEPIA